MIYIQFNFVEKKTKGLLNPQNNKFIINRRCIMKKGNALKICCEYTNNIYEQRARNSVYRQEREK